MSEVASRYDALRTPLVVGRVPLFPVSAIVDVFADPRPLDALRRFLRSSAPARQALFVASPALADAVETWLDDGPLRNPSTPLRALAYVARMSARPTPFGLCAGIGTVQIGEHATLEVDEASRRTRTRPDMGLMSNVIEGIEAGAARRRIAYRTNGAAFVRGGRLYVTNVALTSWEREKDEADFVTAQIPVSLKNTEAVQFVREFSSEPRPYGTVVAALVERFSATTEESERLFDRLIEAGLVISEMRVSPVGDPIASLCRRIKAIDVQMGERLQEALDGAAQLDALPLEERSADAYRALGARLSELSPKPPKHCFQVDMHAPFRGTLPAGVLHDVELMAEWWVRFCQVAVLDDFRTRFVTRYEGVDRMVPLLELVDPNAGLGIPEALRYVQRETRERDELLLKIACEAIRTKTYDVELTARELEVLAPAPPSGERVPYSAEIGFSIAATSRSAVERGEYLLVPPAFFASDRATRSLGRFASMFGEESFDRIRLVARAGLDPSILSAELAFPPAAARSSNVMIRPELVDASIEIGIGEAASPNALMLDDLWVGLDDERFFLWSQSLGRRVVPCESHVFTTEHGAPNICRFLAIIGGDGRRSLSSFQWGPAAQFLSLPRVRVGKIVLSPRQWFVRREAFGNSAAETAAALEGWRELWAVPRYVLLTDSDNRLPVDLGSPVAAELIYDQMKQRKEGATFVEMLPSPEQMWVEGANAKGYTVEFVASVLPRQPRVAAKEAASPIVMRSRRRFGLGSSWVYAKVYMGEQAIEDFLLRTVVPLVGELRASRHIDRWFYVRYADPQSHLRLRLHADGPSADRVREHLIEAAEGWLNDERVVRYAFDTYDPEYERYGGEEGVEAAERFFVADSEECIEYLSRTPDTSGARVAAAVESFAARFGDDDLASLALSTFDGVKRKLSSEDRESLKRLDVPGRDESCDILCSAVAGKKQLLGALFHMHCNRLGVSRDAEPRAVALLRAFLLSRRARAGTIARL